jgi:hypothetical protein
VSKKILFLSPYPVDKAPSQRLKYEQYFSAFLDNGYQIKTVSFANVVLISYINSTNYFYVLIQQYFIIFNSDSDSSNFTSRLYKCRFTLYFIKRNHLVFTLVTVFYTCTVRGETRPWERLQA